MLHFFESIVNANGGLLSAIGALHISEEDRTLSHAGLPYDDGLEVSEFLLHKSTVLQLQ